MLFMIMDVESIGLYGEAFAVGYIMLDAELKEFAEGIFCCDPKLAIGCIHDYAWIEKNVPKLEINCLSPRDVRQRFWEDWVYYKNQGALLFADCSYPVETNFLAQCVKDNNKLNNSPYPLYDIASMLFSAGYDPIANYERREDELPKHDPVKDARQSSRLLIKAFSRLNVTLPL